VSPDQAWFRRPTCTRRPSKALAGIHRPWFAVVRRRSARLARRTELSIDMVVVVVVVVVVSRLMLQAAAG
jgi:hypothetical protein